MNNDNAASGDQDLEKATSHAIAEIADYVPNAVFCKTIINKPTGSIRIMFFDTGEGLKEKTSPFDTFVQTIEGRAEIVIDHVLHLAGYGQCITIPAHLPYFIRPNGRFKMLHTVIKSGYE